LSRSDFSALVFKVRFYACCFLFFVIKKQISNRATNTIVYIVELDRFSELGFKILATNRTHRFLKSKGIETERILKMREGRPNIIDAIKTIKPS